MAGADGFDRGALQVGAAQRSAQSGWLGPRQHPGRVLSRDAVTPRGWVAPGEKFFLFVGGSLRSRFLRCCTRRKVPVKI